MPGDNGNNLRAVWSTGLGLLPVPLIEDPSIADSRYVMLNGSQGNFILDLRGQRPDAESRSVAWSANVGHHVALIDDQIEVQRWDTPVSNIERYSYRSVASNLEQFHLHLEKNAPRPDLSVVAHGIRLFRSLRASLGRDVGGPDALQVFLVLLASGTDGASRQMLDLNRWKITSTARDIALQVPEETWATLTLELLSGRRVDGLKPNLDILLRHAAGVLFQEAHYEAVFAAEEQLRFGVFAPDPVTIGKGKTGVGLHFTPAPLARTLVEECLAIHERSGDKVTIFDPACGSGEFLREARRQLRLSGYTGGIHLVGWDISPAACAIARFILARDTGATAENLIFEIHNVDALSPKQEWPQDVDIIVTNPPFVSWQGMTPSLRERVTQILGSLAKQRPDLATAFLWRACSILGRGAVIGSILPASFLNGSSSASVRGELSRAVTTRLVARLGSHVLFPGALVDAAFYVGSRNGKAAPATLAVWADYRPTSSSGALRALRKLRLQGGNRTPVVKEGFSIYEAPELGIGQVSWSPRPYDAWSLRQQLLRSRTPTVAELFEVHQGAITGNNKAFVITREECKSLPKGEQKFFRPAVLNASIREGRLDDSFYVFFPYGKHAISTTTDLREVVPVFHRKYLKVHELALKKRPRIAPDRWWKLSLERTWQVNARPKLLSTYFGSQGSFGWDRGGQFVVVQGYGWIARKHVPVLTETLALSYLAILNSEIFSKLLAAASNNVAGGQWNLSPRFINIVPLPNLFAAEVNPDLLATLASAGRSIQERGLDALSHLEREQLHEAVTRAYGLNRAD